jgi:hypothetical protein
MMSVSNTTQTGLLLDAAVRSTRRPADKSGLYKSLSRIKHLQLMLNGYLFSRKWHALIRCIVVAFSQGQRAFFFRVIPYLGVIG